MHTGSLAGRPCAWRQQGGNQIFAVVIAAVLVLADEAGNGADRLAMRQQKLKCGTNCGSCLPELKRIANTGKAGA